MTETTKEEMVSYLTNLISSPIFKKMFGLSGVETLDEIKQLLIRIEAREKVK